MKVVLIKFALFSLLLISCNRRLYKNLESEIRNSNTAVLSAKQFQLSSDSAPAIKSIGYFYNTIYGLDENSVVSSEANPAIFFVQRPTIVYQSGSGSPLILYPGDSLHVDYDIYGEETFATTSDSRKAELQGFGEWCLFLKRNSYKIDSFYRKLTMTDQEAISQTESIKSVIRGIEKNTDTAVLTFVKKFNLSSEQADNFLKFKKAYLLRLELDYYWSSRKYSASESVFLARYTGLVNYFNSLKSIKDISFNFRNLRELLRQIMSYRYGVGNVYDMSSLKSYLNFAEKMFRGISYNYLCANIIYTAYKNKVISSKELLRYSRKNLKNKYYKSAIKAISASYSKSEYYLATTTKSTFISKSGMNSGATENEILDKFKGKLVLVDFWASWCVPCRREMPAMREIKKEYVGKDIVFITISIDNSLLSWQKAHDSEKLTDETSFLMNTKDSVFVFMNKIIGEIPRYILINKDGSLISDNAPSPADTELRKLIDKYLFE
jgi:thiol-disulfide isomerase/thioredoxin